MSIDLLKDTQQERNKSPERIVSPEMEEMKDTITGILTIAETRANISVDQHNKLVDRVESNNPLRRQPKAEQLREAKEESGEATFAASIAKQLSNIIDAAPKESTTGISLQIVEHEGTKLEKHLRLEVGKIEDGILFKVIHDRTAEGEKDIEKTFILSDEGVLSSAWYDEKGERKTLVMRGPHEELHDKAKFESETGLDDIYDTVGPSWDLHREMHSFHDAVTREIGGQHEPKLVLPNSVEISALKKPLEMPERELDKYDSDLYK